jgi:LPXTG-motif cell wall-anchored protein
MTRRLFALTLAALAIVPAAPAAATPPVFGLRAVGNNTRGYFVYSLAAGRSQSGAVIVSNAGTAKGTVKLFTADATTGHTTGTVYLTDKKPTRAGSWITLSATSLTLAPGQHKRVPFTLHVPAGQKPGQWVGGIVAETSHQVAGSKSKQKASVQIRIRDLTIVAVQANVPGAPIVSFDIGRVSTGGQRGFQQVIVHLKSTGNQLAKPTGKVSVYDASGKLLETLPFTMDTFLPQTSIDYPVLLKKALAAGDYRATVTLDVNGQTFSAKPAFSVSKQEVAQVFTSASPTQAPPVASSSSGTSSTPWVAIAIGAAIVILLLLLLLWLLRRRRKTPPQQLREVLRASQPLRAEEPLRSEPSPLPPEPAVAAEPPASMPAPRASCDPYHYWDVAYDRGQLGEDGVWRFPHRCRTCGLEVLASDVADASAQAERQS